MTNKKLMYMLISVIILYLIYLGLALLFLTEHLFAVPLVGAISSIAVIIVLDEYTQHNI